MPYCELKTTVKVSKTEKSELSHALAKVIELIPGKSERWVMSSISDNVAMTFSGTDNTPCAMLVIKTFGELLPEQYNLLTEKFCDLLHSFLKIPTSRTYVVYEPVSHWGWDCKNF